MERIKNLEKLILTDFEVIVKLVEEKPKSGIIKSIHKSDLGNEASTAYGVVVAKGSKVEDLNTGDIVIKTRVEGSPAFKYKGDTYMTVSRHQIFIAVTPDNFTSTENEISA